MRPDRRRGGGWRRRGRAGQIWVREQTAFLIVVAVLVGAFCFLAASPAHPIRGVLAIAAGAVLAAVLRLLLPAPSVGMLAVRGRAFDVVLYVVLGGLIVASSIRLKQ